MVFLFTQKKKKKCFKEFHLLKFYIVLDRLPHKVGQCKIPTGFFSTSNKFLFILYVFLVISLNIN